MTAPLAGRRIAVTRPDAGELGAELSALGATVVHVPLIEIAEPLDGGAALRRALARLDAFDWLVVTSANGARRAGPAAADHPAVRLAAVGPATAAALAEAAGRDVDLVPALAQAEGLLAEFPRDPARVLLAQADRARTVLADGLAAIGHAVECVTAYRTAVRAPTPAEVEQLRDVDVVVLASGSAAEGWAAAAGGSSRAAVVALGPVTAAAAAKRGVTVAHVSSSPGARAVADVVVTVTASSGETGR
jgi:uroporphyrinogen-III synthase